MNQPTNKSEKTDDRLQKIQTLKNGWVKKGIPMIDVNTSKTKTSPSESDDDDEESKNLIDLIDRFRG